jgi:hypothetical protein
MLAALAEVLVVQMTSSVFLYGYFRRTLGPAERFVSFAIVMLGYTAIMRPEALYTYLSLGSAAAFLAWVSRSRPSAVTRMCSGQEPQQ